MARGRPRIPLETLKLHGGFRANEHAGRLNEPQMTGEPVKPDGMDSVASRLWDRIVPQLISARAVREIDTSAVESACRLWSLFLSAAKAAEKMPCDKEMRSAVTAYFSAWDKAASKIGLNPIDRAKLSVPDQPKPGGVGEFTRKRG